MIAEKHRTCYGLENIILTFLVPNQTGLLCVCHAEALPSCQLLPCKVHPASKQALFSFGFFSTLSACAPVFVKPLSEPCEPRAPGGIEQRKETRIRGGCTQEGEPKPASGMRGLRGGAGGCWSDTLS